MNLNNFTIKAQEAIQKASAGTAFSVAALNPLLQGVKDSLVDVSTAAAALVAYNEANTSTGNAAADISGAGNNIMAANVAKAFSSVLGRA